MVGSGILGIRWRQGESYGYITRKVQIHEEQEREMRRAISWGFIDTLLCLLFVALPGVSRAETDSPSTTSSSYQLPTGMEFVTIPAGSFQMGSPLSESDRESNEKQHRVTVRSFELMTTEVTQGMWREVLRNNPASGYGVGDNYPVYNVSWYDCQEFIAVLNALDSRYTYRLPTEAEWEYACRAGTTTRFHWGNSDSSSDAGLYTWYLRNSNSATQPVAEKLPNPWGLYDMNGNVIEWCQDVFTRNYDDCPTDGSAYAGSGSSRVSRGGSWFYDARYCRSAIRYYYGPETRYNSLGFRLARSAR